MPPSDVPVPSVDAPLEFDEPEKKDAALRNLEIEETSNRYVIHRVSMALIPLFIRMRISPNTVSCLGALSGFTAAWFYFHYDNPVACLLGFVFMAGWHVFDGADGQLARRTGQVSPSGFIIDGICDYATFIFVYVALGLALSPSFDLNVWGILIAAGVCHAIQAAAFEMQREFYIQHTKVSHPQDQSDSGKATSSTATLIARGYRAVQQPFRPFSYATEQRLRNGTDNNLATQAYRIHFRKAVLGWSLLSANNRTIAIFIFCLIGQPLAYFVYEIGVLSFLLVGLIIWNKKAEAAFKLHLNL
jgi:phosphatidylglycerophosphate synthase